MINKNKVKEEKTNRLSADALWDKAGTDQPITKSDIGINKSMNGNGMIKSERELNILKYNDQSKGIYKGSDD